MEPVRPHKPLIPMGAITGKPSRTQLRKCLEDYRKIGFDQFMIYPRSGLELEYMGAEWLEACRHIIEYAAEHGLAIWLYDEYNWPSGQCKGQVVKDEPGFQARVLTAGQGATDQIIWKIVCCPELADVLNPAAMRKFIELTHVKYFNCFKQYFGRVIKGIFTDEPSYAFAVEKVMQDTGARLGLPYYDGLEDDYLEKTGRSLRADAEKSLAGRPPADLWNVFYGLIGARFKKSYFSPIKEWCQAHHVFFTGHLLGESSAGNAIWYSGTPLSCIRELSLPGIDEVFTSTDIERVEWLTLHLGRYAALRQGTGALAELFALGPPDMSFGKLRQMLCLAAMHGIDRYVLAVAPLDARGNIEKNNYFTAFTPLQTYFNEMPLLQQAAQEAAAIAARKPAPGIALRFPRALASAEAGAALTAGSSPGGQEQTAAAFNRLLQTMVRRQWPIRLIDENELSGDAPAVISLEPNGWKLEIAGGAAAQALSLEELFRQLEEKVARRVKVLDADRRIADNLLVEEYADGVVVLNLTDRDRTRLECRGKIFTLPARGLKIITGKTAAAPKVFSAATGRTDQEFELALDRNNLMRCRFYATPEGPAFRFINRTRRAISGVKLLLRRYANAAKAILDGKEIICANPCRELTPGLNELYGESEKFELSAAFDHVLRLSGGTKDEMFLPLAFLAGKFGLYPGFMLTQLPVSASIGDMRAQGLLNYAGTISLQAAMTIPESAELLRLNTGEQITAVSLNGISLGTRAWAPFEWQIPPARRGQKVVCTIIQTLSIGAVFGDYDPNSIIPRPVTGNLPGKFAAAGCLAPPEWLCHAKMDIDSAGD